MDSIELLDRNRTNTEKHYSSSSICGDDLPDIPIHLYDGTKPTDNSIKGSKISTEKSPVDNEEKDETIVKYLYYSLMCCECNIS